MLKRSAGPTQLSSAKKRRLDALQQRSTITGTQRDAASPGLNEKQKQPPAAGSQPPKASPAATGFLYETLDTTRFSGVLARKLENPDASKGAPLQFLRELMSRAVGASQASKAIKQKLTDRVLQLDNPAAAQSKLPGRRKRRKGTAAAVAGDAAAAPTRAVARQKAKQRLKLPPEQCKHELLEPLRQLWLQYVAPMLRHNTPEQALLQADLHGCGIKVVASKIERHVGREGTVVVDGSNSFTIVTTDDQQMVLGKRGLTVQIPVSASQAIVLNCDLAASKSS